MYEIVFTVALNNLNSSLHSHVVFISTFLFLGNMFVLLTSISKWHNYGSYASSAGYDLHYFLHSSQHNRNYFTPWISWYVNRIVTEAFLVMDVCWIIRETYLFLAVFVVLYSFAFVNLITNVHQEEYFVC